MNSQVIKGPGKFGSWSASGDHPNNSIIENGQNTEKSPGDLRRLDFNQSPVKNHQLTLMGKPLMSNNNNNNNRICHLIDFAVPANHREKIIEREKINKYLNLARELKKTCET